ncbi:MAG: sugar ABC transporter substrate-binding protein [Verrucomicrobia bacterium]|nr:sugar ABC transporter substrate-binding protein [Verrucomicrobiota bacterium]MCH8511262.1 sugar ABC transporter substrate-binding protein [Kiritimatiellia bacterium]
MKISQQFRLFLTVFGLLGFGIFLSGCGSAESGETLRVWAHQGQEAENQAMREIVASFNEAHAIAGIRAEIEFFPDHQYSERIAAGAAAGDLPDIMDLDGPTLARYVDAGLLAPLDDDFSEAELADFLPTIIAQGTIDDRLYALGAFDSALVLYYDREILAAAGVTPPNEDRPWTWDEFLAACATLKEAGVDPVSLHMDESADEWYTYAFSPVIWSAGGSLMDPDTGRIEGVLNAPENIEALRQWQQLFALDYADNSPVEPNPFGLGKTAMDWSGHWMARSHLEAKREALGAAPLPVVGEHRAAASGSWAWAMLSTSDRPDVAAKFLRWVVSTENGIVPIVRANGAVPARRSAFEAFPEYEEIPYRLFKRQLTEHGRPRPQTPHYPALTRNFAEALRDIANGADPAETLTRAATQAQAVADR